jgi:hypothetical protein
MTVKKIEARRGLEWLKEGYRLYKQHPWQWTLISFCLILVPQLFGQFVPGMGWLVGEFLQTILMIGVYRLALQTADQGSFEVGLFFQDLNNTTLWMKIVKLKAATLLLLVLLTLGFLGLNALLGITTRDFVSLGQIIQSQSFYLIPDSMVRILIFDVVLLSTCFLLIGGSLIFAPALLAYSDISILSALRLSLRSNVVNVGAFTLYALGTIPLFLLTLLTVGLGTLVVLPVIILSFVFAFRDIFLAPS